MAYLKRKIDLFLQNWYHDPDKKPLIIKGARQIGKTSSIRQFASSFYDHFVEINFIEKPRFRTILEDGYETDLIVRNITRIDPGISFVPGKTLLFFDEIQSCPDIVTSLKFFAEDGKYDVKIIAVS